MTRPSSLRCRACGEVRATASVQYCEECFGPLDLVPGPPGATGDELRARIEAGPPSMWRYAPLLPVPAPPGAESVGWTPLRPAPALGGAVGVADLWLKDESANPAGSFKDRVVAAALGRALEDGRRVAACASTGNLAHAVAGGARRAGMGAVVLVPAALPGDDRAAIAAAGATVVPVEAGYDAVNRLAVEASMVGETERWAWVNVGLRPWYVEGSATVAHEIAEQLGWRVPDAVVAPMASGAFALALHRAFVDLAAVGLVPAGPPPALWVAQPAGCAPVAAAFAAGADDVAPVRPDTAAPSLAMGDPPDGPEVLAAARASTGGVVAVPEHEIAPAQRRLAELEGVAAEPAGGVVVGATARIAAAGRLPAGATVVACITGGAHDRWVPDPGAPDRAGQGPGRVTGTIPPTVSALSAEVAGGPTVAPEEPNR
ncbi:MAG: threonine synthase [Acidimicrobiales bacterium]|nr:threonine synthase [Acidimicrobiales bacterium]MCB9373891.1 threonine synthase [Microthrixaceae bacterium]